MSAQPTPGPWTYRNWRNSRTDAGIGIEGPQHEETADVPLGHIADARLIAAAPELLAALEETLEELEIARDGELWPTGASAVAHRARAAIAKATGK
jgi:hypothetical protein